MASLKFLTEPDQHLSDEVRELVERLRAAFRAEPSESVWSCWVSVGTHGLTVRLQEVRRVAPYGGRSDRPSVTYSGGGTSDFLVQDVTDWLRAQTPTKGRAPDAPIRRRAYARRRRNDAAGR